MSVSRAWWAFSLLVFGGMRPRRVLTRWTWVSTGRALRPRAKQRTIAAVLGPTPSMLVSHFLASWSVIFLRGSRVREPKSCFIFLSAFFM